MSAQAVSDATGGMVSRARIADVEGVNRGGDIRVAELLTIAHALDASPADLLFPGDEAEIAPCVVVSRAEAQMWLSGIDADIVRQGELRKAEQELAEAQARVEALRKASK